MSKTSKFYNGNCYQNAFNYVDANKGWTLVHGTPTLQAGPHAGKRFGHAWAEKGGLVYDGEKGITLPKELYYAIGNITYTVKYTRTQARAMAVKHKTYGAWDKTIQGALHS